jgi:putative ABC transport system permease protein
MSSLRLILASLFHYWRTNLAVACGVAVATAVLSGALLVGDSVHGSLERIALDRLGRIDDALVTDRFFSAELAGELAGEAARRGCPLDAAPAVLLRATLENPGSQAAARAGRVELVGCDERFWEFGTGRPRNLPGAHEIVLNQPMAQRLGARIGDTILLRLPRQSPIPADTALGKKKETVRMERVVVREIISAEGLGRFGLWPTQRPPQNAYVSLAWLQQSMNEPGRVNAILVANRQCDQTNSRRLPAPGSGEGGEAGTFARDLSDVLRPRLSDYGLRVERAPAGYWTVTCDRMLISPATEQAIVQSLSFVPHPSLTYLANTLYCNGREIPYSTIAAIDFATRPPLGPMLSRDGKPLSPLGVGEIALNSWAADQLRARPGDSVQVTYFEPESVGGQLREKTVSLQLAAVVKLAGLAADRALVPAVKDMTDQLTMSNWDPPFPFDARRIRPADEDYWKQHGPTPKAFVSLATGRQLWGSRFGQTTAIQVAEEGVEPLHTQLERRMDPAAMGFVFQPVRRQALAAAAGTTPFGVLFLSFSFLLIAAAAMLVALLFRLGVEQRARQIGTLLAIGLSRRQVGWLLMGEGFWVAAGGSLLGVPLGVGYAALMLLGLQTWWLPAIGTTLLRLHVTAASLTAGFVGGLAVALLATWLASRGINRLSPRRLIAGQATREGTWRRRAKYETVLPDSNELKRNLLRLLLWLLLFLIATPVAVLLIAGGSVQAIGAGVFFAVGTILLGTLCTSAWLCLQVGATGPAVAVGLGNLARLAIRNAGRNPTRSALSVGLVAAAAFLIVATSAFRVDSRRATPSLASGDGGFALAAESDQPIFQDLGTKAGRTASGFSAANEELLDGVTVTSLRVHAGDDASCQNLYRARQPRVLGLPRQFLARGGFVWAERPRQAANPWLSLATTERPSNVRQPVPVILEKDTANYALGLWGGIGETFSIADGHGRTIELRVAGLLSQSIFQGDLLISEQDFLRLFPETSGYRFFLVESPPQQAPAVARALEQELADYGWAAQTTTQRLADFSAIQNTYLSAFQSLGGLGLLLGTFGLAAVQCRGVLERRGELALLRAVGFRRRTLGWLMLLEHAVLLSAGLGTGLIAALVAVLPHLLSRAAPLPYASLAVTFAAVVVVGGGAGGLAARAAIRAPLLPALRGE